MIVRLFFVFLLVCTSDVHAGVLDRLDEVGDAVKPGSKDAGSSTGEMPDGPADEKFSDFVKEAHGAAKGTKYAAKGLGAVPPFKEGMPELENISKGAGKTADALKGARAIQEIEEGKRTGTSKAAELGLKYGAGKASGILAKPVTGTVEAAAQGVDKVNATLDNPTEENSAETIRHVEEFQNEAAKNAGVDIEKAKGKVGGWRDWFYDQAYKVTPGWIPANERNKRDQLKQEKSAWAALREYAGASSEEGQAKLDAEEQEKLLQKWVERKE